MSEVFDHMNEIGEIWVGILDTRHNVGNFRYLYVCHWSCSHENSLCSWKVRTSYQEIPQMHADNLNFQT
jgi:hypothetical protein